MSQGLENNCLDNLGHVQKLDKSDMLGLLLDFPGQLKKALEIVKGVKLPKNTESISNIVFSGLGGSAIGGDVVRCCLTAEMKIPFVVNRDYDIPVFVNSKTLFFTSSYSGNTEETLSAYKKAREKKARIIVLTGGGKLEGLAKKDGYPLISIPEKSIPPRCALGYSFVPVLIALSKTGLIKDKRKDISDAMDIISELRNTLVGSGVRLKNNLAKKIAADLFGRFPAVYGGTRHLECVITRWRGQFCENSKTLASNHFLPEMDHNEIMGFSHSKDLLRKIVVIFLRDKEDHKRVKDRIEITGRIIRPRVCKIIELNSVGNTLLSRICSLIYIGDFVSFYLAILNNEDPTPVDEITYLKKELAKRK